MRAHLLNGKEQPVASTIVTQEPRTIAGGFVTITIGIICIISVLFAVLNRVDPLTADLDKRSDVVNKDLALFEMKFIAHAADVICDIFQPSSLQTNAVVNNEHGYLLTFNHSLINITEISHTGTQADYLITLSSFGQYFDGTQDMSLLLKRECFSVINFRPIAQLRKINVNGTYFIDAEHHLPYYEAAAIYTRNFKYSWDVTTNLNFDQVKFSITWYALEPIVDVVSSVGVVEQYQQLIGRIYPIFNSSKIVGDQFIYVMESKDCFMFNKAPTRPNMDVIQVKFTVDNSVKQRYYENNSSRLSRIPLAVLASLGSIIALRGPATWLVILVLDLLSSFMLLKSFLTSIVVLGLTAAHLSIYSAQAITNYKEFEHQAIGYTIVVMFNCMIVAVIYHFMLIWNMEFCSTWRKADLYDLWGTFSQPLRMVKRGITELTGFCRFVFCSYMVIYALSFFASILMSALAFAHWTCGPIAVVIEIASIAFLQLVWSLYLRSAMRRSLAEDPLSDELVAFVPIH